MTTMKDGIRKVKLARESKAKGKPVYAYKVPYRTEDGRQTSETFHSLKEAKAFRDKRRSNANEGLTFDLKAGKVSFREYAERWLETKRAVRRGNTARQYGDCLKLAYPVIGSRAIGSLRRSDIQGMVTALIASPELGPSSVRQVYDRVRMVFRSAVRDKVVQESPCAGIDLPELPKSKAVPFTVPQVNAIADNVDGLFKAMVLLAACTGLRAGECFGLTVDRIDFLRKTVTVDRQMVNGHMGPPKSKASYRTVPLPDFILPILSEHIRAYARTVKLDGEEYRLMFTTSTGLVLRGNSFSHAWQRAIKAAELPGVNFHMLRHTYASLLIARNLSPKKIQVRLGHANISETMDTYGHLYPDDDESTREVIDAAFGAPVDTKLTDDLAKQAITRSDTA
jgi:integrase